MIHRSRNGPEKRKIERARRAEEAKGAKRGKAERKKGDEEEGKENGNQVSLTGSSPSGLHGWSTELTWVEFWVGQLDG
eukprot:2571812-Amphidinium_carterae.1